MRCLIQNAFSDPTCNTAGDRWYPQDDNTGCSWFCSPYRNWQPTIHGRDTTENSGAQGEAKAPPAPESKTDPSRRGGGAAAHWPHWPARHPANKAPWTQLPLVGKEPRRMSCCPDAVGHFLGAPLASPHGVCRQTDHQESDWHRGERGLQQTAPSSWQTVFLCAAPQHSRTA